MSSAGPFRRSLSLALRPLTRWWPIPRTSTLLVPVARNQLGIAVRWSGKAMTLVWYAERSSLRSKEMSQALQEQSASVIDGLWPGRGIRVAT